jgi:hypothetical protein
MRKTLVVTSMVTMALLFSGCAGSTDESAETGSTNETTSSLPPKEQFIKVLNENFDSRLKYWSEAPLVNDQALSKFITDIKVESDEAFSKITITANAELDSEQADLSMGSLVGTQMDNVNGLRAVVYCAGKSYPNDEDTFNIFVKTMAIDFQINDEMAALKFPSEGIIVKMVWNKAVTTVDKYGTETKKLSIIGTDQVGISTENFGKIADVYSAKYRELSDIAPAKYAKKSWHDGLCATGQSLNN